MAVKAVINTEKIENLLQENQVEELLELARTYKEKGVFENMLGLRYVYGSCTLFHAMIKYSDKKTIRSVFDYVIKVMGRNYFLKEANKTLDRYARNILILAAKHQNMDIVLCLLNEYELNPNQYCRFNKMSALSYLVKRKKFDVAQQVLDKMDPTGYSEQVREWFQQDLSQLKASISDSDLATTEWLSALTMKHTGKGRMAKFAAPVLVEKASFEKQRLRQIMRHVSIQLFERWSELIDDHILDDVQLMCVEKASSRENPNPKPCLFIACTPLYAGEIILNDFKLKSFREMLTTTYETEFEINQERVKRVRKKLGNRVWGKDNSKATKASKKIGEALKNEVKRHQKVINTRNGVKLPYFEYQEKTVYLLTTEGYARKGTHAEEILTEVADYIKTDNTVKCSIFGKSRACISCTGRMISSGIDAYNKHNGFLWLSAAEQQDEAATSETVNLLFNTPSYITTVGDTQTPQYDTASDSE